MKTFLAVSIAILMSALMCRADLLDALGLKKPATNSASILPSTLTTSLSQEQMISGLKEALGKGVQQAIANLGHDGGFLSNVNVRIPMPDKLKTVERTLRSLRQDKLADDFVATMNHAAEQAVPAAADVFGDALKSMSIEDGKSILLGTNNAATEYFRRVSSTNLFERFLPIVKKATDGAGVTSAYKKFMDKAGSASSFGSFGKALSSLESVDVDAYVTNKSLDGLFKMVADEETKIRQNPVARTSALLQQVFGAVSPVKH